MDIGLVEADGSFIWASEEPARRLICIEDDPRFWVSKKDGVWRAFEQGPILSFALPQGFFHPVTLSGLPVQMLILLFRSPGHYKRSCYYPSVLL
jgi:hypothetical protein